MPSSRPALPRAIWAIGFVSMFMDISSEMIHALLPVYLTTVLGASMMSVGLIEGIAEATASITKLFSGAVSDWFGKRKLLAVIGYGLAAFTKPVFPLAGSIGWITAARFIDRIGKGIRGAPRDALVADIAPKALRGAAFGLRQSLDTVGAFLGPVIAIALMWWSANDFKFVFWIAVIPAFVAVAVLVLGVKEPADVPRAKGQVWPLSGQAMKAMGASFWLIMAIATLFTLARFSEAFLILKAQQSGLSLMLIPMVLVVMNVTYALASYPAGVLSDRFGRAALLGVGMMVLIGADIVLARATTLAGVAGGIILWGLHMGLTQGTLSTLVADHAPKALRGTAFGFYNLVTGLALLAASLLAGYLWDIQGAALTFYAGAGFAAFALALLALTNAFILAPDEDMPGG
ncbi:MAG: MFS transporter [Rhizobiaceae bacterium]